MQTRVLSPRAFTLIELLVVVVIIAILAGLLMPMLGRSKREAQAVLCTGNLRQLTGAAMAYAAEHEMTLPMTSHQRGGGNGSWAATLQKYAEGKIVFRCPCDEDRVRIYTYVINDFLTPNPGGAPELNFSRLVGITQPSDTVLFTEATKTYTNADHFHFSEYHEADMPFGVFADQVAVERHNGAANYAFADGHLEKLTLEQVRKRLMADESRFLNPTGLTKVSE